MCAAARTVVGMWAEQYYEEDSEYLTFPKRIVTPKPWQDPHPPAWMAASTESSACMAGENGLGLLCFSIMQPLGKLKPVIDAYRRAFISRAGRFPAEASRAAALETFRSTRFVGTARTPDPHAPHYRALLGRSAALKRHLQSLPPTAIFSGMQGDRRDIAQLASAPMIAAFATELAVNPMGSAESVKCHNRYGRRRKIHVVVYGESSARAQSQSWPNGAGPNLCNPALPRRYGHNARPCRSHADTRAGCRQQPPVRFHAAGSHSTNQTLGTNPSKSFFNRPRIPGGRRYGRQINLT